VTSAEETVTLDRLVERYDVEMTVVKIPDPPPWNEDKPYGGQGWQCVILLDGRSLTTPFWQGSGHRAPSGLPSRPKARDVLECLLSDASGADQSFEDWCGDYGYDTDSRRAYAQWNACVGQTAQLKLLLADKFDRFMEAER
jgi:hypothetical protein